MSMIRWSLRRAALAVVPLLFAGCASVRAPAPAAPELFDDAQFAVATEPLDPADVFRVTPAMKAYIDETIMPLARSKGLREALTEALYNRSKLQLEYDSSTTRTAAEAFSARQGNCLSLVIMTGAFASAMGLTVTYQQVSTDEMWSRSGDMYFMSGHVNLTLERREADIIGHFDRRGLYTIDFIPGANAEWNVRPLRQETVLAMFLNNRAAEAMVRGKLDDAYWRLRQAIRFDPGFLSAYNTLGVVYLRHGDPARAEQVLRRALAAAPDDAPVLANYAQALQDLGRMDEARQVQAHLAAVEPVAPFLWFVQGQAALRRGDYLKARELFVKEIERAPDYHEFHYALAVADFGLGRLEEAHRELALAMNDAVRRSDHDLYAAKLDRLKAWQASRAATASTMQ